MGASITHYLIDRSDQAAIICASQDGSHMFITREDGTQEHGRAASYANARKWVDDRGIGWAYVNFRHYLEALERLNARLELQQAEMGLYMSFGGRS